MLHVPGVNIPSCTWVLLKCVAVEFFLYILYKMDLTDENEIVVDIPLGVSKGMTFTDFEQFQSKLEITSKQKFVQLYKPLARTIEAAKKKGVKRYLKPELKYYSVQWACIHGGRRYRSRGKGIRKAK